jgi:hypothetical protein
MIALRTELSMRVVMPAVLPHSAGEPYLRMARFEAGASGNPHFHGFSLGAGGPRLGRVRADRPEDHHSGDEGGAPPTRTGRTWKQRQWRKRLRSRTMGIMRQRRRPSGRAKMPTVSPRAGVALRWRVRMCRRRLRRWARRGRSGVG